MKLLGRAWKIRGFKFREGRGVGGDETWHLVLPKAPRMIRMKTVWHSHVEKYLRVTVGQDGTPGQTYSYQ